MKYDDYSDSQLVSLINESSEEAKDILYDKYKYIIDIMMKKYSKTARKLGVNYYDLHQEALVGFADALRCYNDHSSSLPTFITLCVERKIKVCLMKANTHKSKLNEYALSLEYVYDAYNIPLMDTIKDRDDKNPLVNITNEENFLELLNTIKENLSDFESEVFSLLVNGVNYKEIALLLDKEPKQIDNTLQRIKAKVRKILDSR